ncbi:Uncharacterised protein [Streptococcus pyogenes]|nr:Uncharacterised protein [Streptococcus pyogenes]SQE91122.1 Uncharacterised protein [Streptococcus pyogenes]SQF18346.1 Uncharacterised protein [Streptococcus pyogenes]SQF34482.1 Uncharacterised protein [Streptococcus pyogenes]
MGFILAFLSLHFIFFYLFFKGKRGKLKKED